MLPAVFVRKNSVLSLVVFALIVICSALPIVHGGGLFSVNLVVEPTSAGTIGFGNYGIFPSGSTISVPLGAYPIVFYRNSSSPFNSWAFNGGVLVSATNMHSVSGTAVVFGSGTLIAVVESALHSVIRTATRTTTWSSSTTYLTTIWYAGNQTPVGLAPKINVTSIQRTPASMTGALPTPQSNMESGAATQRFELNNFELGGAQVYTIATLITAVFLLMLATFGRRIRRKIRH